MSADQTSERQFSIEVFGATDVGRTREHNEDAFVAFGSDTGILTWFEDAVFLRAPDARLVLMVADGMGGAAAGEVASALALDTVVSAFQNAEGISGQWTMSDAEALLLSATVAANRRVHEAAMSDASLRGMGTTATIAALCDRTLLISQIGDSRAYLHRRGVLTQLTRDQSLIQRLVDAGDLTPEEASRNDRRNIILQALGPEPTVTIDISVQQISDGDTLLLCTDGLSGQLSAEDLSALIESTSSLSAAGRSMIDVANERGGPDNITLLLARFTGTALGILPSADHVGYTSVHEVEGAGINASLKDSALETIASTRDDSIQKILADGRAANLRVSGTNAQTAEQRNGELATPVVVMIVAAAALGVATIIYRQFLMG
jgi:serine/threonine protein phosphatase PrpC